MHINLIVPDPNDDELVPRCEDCGVELEDGESQICFFCDRGAELDDEDD